MNWLYYLLEANLYLAVFYGFYLLLLQRETFYQLNRYYLVITSVLAFLLPLLQIGYLHSLVNPVVHQDQVSIIYTGEMLPVTVPVPTLTTGDILFFSYLLIAGFLLIRLLGSFYRIIRMAAKANKIRKDNVVYIHFKDSDVAFSFFNFLFINPETEKQHIIVQHELVHIQQKHSIDILFFEMLLILNWFNPICWFMKKDIKIIHEYIADESTINRGLAKHDYAMFLIHNSFGSFPNPLASQMFNKSILKKRINMLNKTKSAGRARLRLLYVFPIMGGMLCTSTLAFTKDYAVIDLYSKKAEMETTAVNQERKQVPTQEIKQDKKKVYPIESMNDGSVNGTRPVKLVVINGKVSTARNFVSVQDYDEVKELSSAEGTAKYGKRASKGALEFTGKNAKISIKFPPPIVKVVKFPPPIPPKNARKLPTPGKPPLAPKLETVKFPPPIVKPIEKIEDHPDVKGNDFQSITDIGPHPLYINNGQITVVNPGEGKSVTFKAKSVKVTPKNNTAAIAKYGDSARDGVFELEGGEFFTKDATTKKLPPPPTIEPDPRKQN
ncbi:M56 family metallopeptidase [Pedobacter sp. PWIIR3]